MALSCPQASKKKGKAGAKPRASRARKSKAAAEDGEEAEEEAAEDEEAAAEEVRMAGPHMVHGMQPLGQRGTARCLACPEQQPRRATLWGVLGHALHYHQHCSMFNVLQMCSHDLQHKTRSLATACRIQLKSSVLPQATWLR